MNLINKRQNRTESYTMYTDADELLFSDYRYTYLLTRLALSPFFVARKTSS